MIHRIFSWFFSPSQKPIVETNDVYTKLVELEEKYNSLLLDIKHLEEENIEASNCLYELMNSIDAVDARIDILSLETWDKKNV